jgi:hypothetical protein
VVETDTAYAVLPANALEDDVDPRAAQQFHKPEASPALDAALKTRTGRIFMDFARFPWARAEENDEGYDVQIRDLRFYTSDGGRSFVAEIAMDKALRVRSESFSFGAQKVEKARSRGVEE